MLLARVARRLHDRIWVLNPSEGLVCSLVLILPHEVAKSGCSDSKGGLADRIEVRDRNLERAVCRRGVRVLD